MYLQTKSPKLINLKSNQRISQGTPSPTGPVSISLCISLSSSGINNPLLNRRMPINQNSMNKHQSLESHDPITGFAQAFRNYSHTSAKVTTRVTSQVHNFTYVLLISWVFIMSHGFNDENLKVWSYVSRHFS